MKMLVAGAVLATLVASPAFAQSYDPDLGTGNIVQWNDSTTYTGVAPRGAHGAFARVPSGGAASPYAAYGAVTPFGSPAGTNGTVAPLGSPAAAPNAGNHMSAARETALRECALQSRRYTQTTWGTMEVHQHRTCMAEHGQME